MSKTKVVQLKIGDRVRITKYSELFGRSDSREDKAMRAVTFEVTAINPVEVHEDNGQGDVIEGFADLEMVDIDDREPFEYMINNTQVELVSE